MLLAQKPIQINYSYDRVPTIRKFALSEKRMRYVQGPFGSGKSSGCLWELIRRGMQQAPGRDGIRRTRWAIIRNYYPQLRDTTIRTVLDWLPPIIFGHYKMADHQYVITGFEGCEIEFLFRALDRPEQVSNLLSLELTGAWANELREIPWAIMDALDGRIGRYPSVRDGGCTWAGIIGDSNPPDDDSELYHKCEDDKPENMEVFKQPSGLSPEAENLMSEDEYDQYQEDLAIHGQSAIVPGLPPNYYKDLAIGKKQDYIDVYIHGKYGYVVEGRPVYKETWNDALHTSAVALKPVQGRVLIISFDFGLTPAAVITQLTPRGHFNVLREFVSTGIGFKQFMTNIVKPALLMEFRDFEFIFTGDPAGNSKSQTDEQTCYEILNQLFKASKIQPCVTNDPNSRIGSVESFLARLTDGRPTFQLDPSCKVLRKGFNKSYYFKKIQGSDEKYSSEAVKNSASHIHDALQYACYYASEDFDRAHRGHGRRRTVQRHVGKGGY